MTVKHVMLIVLMIITTTMGSLLATEIDTSNPTTLWHMDTHGPVRSTPIIIKDTLYFANDSGLLFAVDKTSGTLKWQFKADSAMPAVPLIEGEHLYITSKKGTLYVISTVSGKELWKFTSSAPTLYEGSWDYFIASPALTSQLVLFASADHTLYALHKEKGTVTWKYTANDLLRATPVVTNNTVFLATMNGELLALSVNKGKCLWTFKTTGSAYFPKGELLFKPLLYDNVVYVGSRDASFYAVDAQTGKLLWKTLDEQGAWYTTATAANGIIYAASSDGHYIQALEAKTGKEKWKTMAQDLIFSTPVVAEGNLYFGSHDGYVYKLNTSTGQIEWRFKTGDDVLGSPVFDAQTLYIGSDDGFLYALTVPQQMVRKKTAYGVYYMPQWDKKVGMINSTLPHDIRDIFGNRGYEILNATKLLDFLNLHVAAKDCQNTVIVLASYVYPYALLKAEENTRSLLGQYLDHGGTLVWLGNVPQLLITLKEKEEKPTIANQELITTLRVDGDFLSHACSYYDAYICTPTAEGKKWGLPEWWSCGYGVKKEQVTTVLGVDEHDRATIWIKNYGGPANTGLLRLWGGATLPKELGFVFTIIE